MSISSLIFLCISAGVGREDSIHASLVYYVQKLRPLPTHMCTHQPTCAQLCIRPPVCTCESMSTCVPLCGNGTVSTQYLLCSFSFYESTAPGPQSLRWGHLMIMTLDRGSPEGCQKTEECLPRLCGQEGFLGKRGA